MSSLLRDSNGARAGRSVVLALALVFAACSEQPDPVPDAETEGALRKASEAVAQGGVTAQQGIDALEELSARFPRSTRVRNALHNAHLALRNWTAAAEAFERFGVAALTDDERLHLGRVHIKAGAPERALELLLPQLEVAPEDPMRAASAARALYAVGRVDETLRVLDTAWPALSEGDDPEAWRLRGLARLRVGDRGGAVSDLDELVDRFPDYAPGHYAFARALTASGEAERAAEHTRQFEALSEATHERSRRQMYLAGRSLELGEARSAGRLDEAIEIAREMRGLAEGSLVLDLTRLLGQLYADAGRSEEARLAREEAARLQQVSP